ncbi:MAG TPA: glutathione S-transferase family protein [Burkholderiales bacterium]|jgi:glutathione S-transferase|nr:glutathione S-transferase family protein [Burkholderiales bacterium]
MKLRLVIGNKNYSSWSMRPWIVLRQADIAFEEIPLKFADDNRVIGIEGYSPTRKVPVLLVDGEPVWDTLAICETLAELYPERQLWPLDAAARRMARSVCAEMHSGFQALRGAMPMNLRSRHPGKGLNADSKRDIERVVAIWSTCRSRFGAGGPLLFGRFSIADAFYTPVVTRFETYGVALPAAAQAYAQAVRDLEAVKAWTEAALRETEFVAADEPYASR